MAQEMSSTAILALTAVIAVVATGGVVIAASGYQQWHGFGGMMGGWPSGNGMMGGDDYYDGSSDYACPMHGGYNGTYNATLGMPCWDANQTEYTANGYSACWGQQYCVNGTSSVQNQYCQNYTACPGISYGMQNCWIYTEPVDQVAAPALQTTNGHCH